MVFFTSWWYDWWYGVEKMGALNAYANALPLTGPYDSVQLGNLKKIDEMLNSPGFVTKKSTGLQVHLTMLLRERAMIALPEDTAALLQANLMSSEVALELVRRNMTEYSQLSSGLYGSTPEDLQRDPALNNIHDRLSMAVELHGVLTLAGITPGEREWAQALADTYVDLRSLRAAPWSEVALLLGLIELSPEKKKQMEEEKAEQTPFGNRPTRTELRVVQELYSMGEGAPAIRSQVLSFRMSLDVAEELEDMGIYDASQITATDTRRLLLGAQEQLAAEKEAQEEADEEAQQAAVEAAKEEEAAKNAASDEYPAQPMVIGDAAEAPSHGSRSLTARSVVVDKDASGAPQPRLRSDAVVGGGRSRADAIVGDGGRSRSDAVVGGRRSRSNAISGAEGRSRSNAVFGPPKLGTRTKLTSISQGGPINLASLGKSINAMQANINVYASVVKNGLGGLTKGINPSKDAKKEKEEREDPVEEDVEQMEKEKTRLDRSLEYVRSELERVDAKGPAAENLRITQAALQTARAQVAVDPNFGARIAEGSSQALQQSLVDQRLSFGGLFGLGSYESNEELVAKASGGLAMYGMNYLPTTTDIVLKPYSPLLQNPSFIEMTGAVSAFESKIEKTTSQTKAATFHNTSSNAGISVAETISTTKGVSASVSARSIFASGSASTTLSQAANGEKNEAGNIENVSKNKGESKTASATIIEYIRCPMKSFRIPMSEMELSAAAYEAAIRVDTLRKGEEFLDNYGSHVATGRQELGGIFFSTITLTSSNEVSEVQMMSAASSKIEDIKSKSTQGQASVSGRYGGFSGKASASFGKATSTGRVEVASSSSGEGNAGAKEEAQYESYIRCVGPNTPTPEAFAEALFTDTSTWAVTDRGRLEAMVSVTDLLEKTYRQIAAVARPGNKLVDAPEDKLEDAILFIKAAWRRRAKRWSYLLQENTGLNVPAPLVNLIKSALPASLGRVATMLKALQDLLVIRHTDKVRKDAQDGVKNGIEREVAHVANTFVNAANLAIANSNSFPAELSFLDAAEVEKLVKEEMRRLWERGNASIFTDHGLTYKDENGGSFVVIEDYDKDKELLISDPVAWDGLEVWQREWIQQSRTQGAVWDKELAGLFQRQHFLEEQIGDGEFIKDLAVGLNNIEQKITFFTAKLSGDETKKTALQRAASEMLKADWGILRNAWIDDKNVLDDPEDDKNVLDDPEDVNLGPEGDALWEKVVKGVRLYCSMADAEEKLSAVDTTLDDEGYVEEDRAFITGPIPEPNPDNNSEEDSVESANLELVNRREKYHEDKTAADKELWDTTNRYDRIFPDV